MNEPQPEGKVAGLISAAKGLTLTNALVIIMIALVLGPIYIFAFHPDVLDRFLSSYQVLNNQVSPCTYRRGRQRGEPYTYGITAGLAYDSGGLWAISVTLTHEPSTEELSRYCSALLLMVDKLRERDADRADDLPLGNGAPAAGDAPP